jgi:cytochrome P450
VTAQSVAAIPDLTDPAVYATADVPGIWRSMRDTDPVHWCPPTAEHQGFWALSRYADVSAVLRDGNRFTSERGNVLATMLTGGDPGAGRMLAVTDGPRHTQLRTLLLKALSPRALEGVVRRVHRTTRRLVTQAVDSGRCDFARDVASYIPLFTICDLLDVPPGDRAHILRLTKSALASDYAQPRAGEDRLARAELLFYFTDLVRARRANPGDDVISLMATATVAGERLDDELIVLNCYSLIMGGDETSRLAMIGAVHALAGDPEQWQVLKSGSTTAECAGEEVLRWTTPTMHFGRAALVDVGIGERTIAAGDLVTLWLAAANRDETAFERPERFDLARTPNRHLALGQGQHFCVGAFLGRTEIAAMLDALRTHVARIEQVGPERRIYSNFLAGINSLPVALHPDPRRPAEDA